MRTKVVDGQTERRIIAAMVTSKEFLARSNGKIDPSLFAAPSLATVAKWCINYYGQHKQAPGNHIQDIYYAWADKNKNHSDRIEMVHDVLEYISKEHENDSEVNASYMLDLAGEHFCLRRLQKIKDNLELTLTNGDRSSAEQVVRSYDPVQLGMGVGVDVLRDVDVWEEAFSKSAEPLFRFPGKESDMFFREDLTRDALVGVLGPEKRGKTWWCVEFAIRALMERRKVALFEVGDMSQSQILRRIGVRLSGKPMFARDCGEIRVPRRFLDGECEYDHVNRDKKASKKSSIEAIRRFTRKYGISNDHTYLMTSVHANSSVSVADLDATIQSWEDERGFIPDVVIIDYPDILAPEPGTGMQTVRDQANATWKALRRLSQERHCLVIAPTQADSASYRSDLLEMGNFSEDKRKLAHVTGMVGLNQTRDEKDHQIMRLNWIVRRESGGSADRILKVGQCLTLGRAYCCSTF